MLDKSSYIQEKSSKTRPNVVSLRTTQVRNLDRNGQKKTETDRKRRKQKETDINGQKQTEIDRKRQKQTETDRNQNRQTRTEMK